MTPIFSTIDHLAFAHRALSVRPAKSHIERAEPRGSIVWSFVLPLKLCPPLNAFAEMLGWRRKKLKKLALGRMLAQNGWCRCDEPLPGRPMVRAIRFSSVEVDADSGWAKIPIDRLTGKNGGLNYIVDDKPTCLDLRPWWEPGRRGDGFCYFEVWSGE